MRLDHYSSKRNARPGYPTAEEIKKTTEAWKGDALATQDAAETINREATNLDKLRHF